MDLDEQGGRALAYRAVLAEGTVEDLERILNRDQLVEAWPALLLPRRVREISGRPGSPSCRMTSSDGPMSHEDSVSARNLEVQREVARMALGSVEGFALAGSSAIREHGMIDRPTEDVDLFTTRQDIAHFGIAVDQITSRLRASGLTVDVVRRAPQFARLNVVTSDRHGLDVDLSVDWRQDDPVGLDTGPVLSLVDAVGNKVSALYSGVEPRDFLDVDAIRRSEKFSDEQLVVAAAE